MPIKKKDKDEGTRSNSMWNFMVRVSTDHKSLLTKKRHGSVPVHHRNFGGKRMVRIWSIQPWFQAKMSQATSTLLNSYTNHLMSLRILYNNLYTIS